MDDRARSPRGAPQAGPPAGPRLAGIAAAIIARDEEEVIVRCLESLSGVDEIVLADTGSKDRTAKIAAGYGVYVTKLPWRNPFHFGDARQAALRATRREWILSIDADEVLAPGGLEILRKLTGNRTVHAWEIGFLHRDRHDGKPVRRSLKRFFMAEKHRWAFRVHEQALGTREATMGKEPGIVLEHFPSKNRERRKGQNFELLELAVEETPDYARLHFYLSHEFWMRNRFAEALQSIDRYLEKGAGEGDLWISEAKLFKGMILGKMGNVDEAIAALEASSRACPDRREPLIHAAELERDRRRFGSAMAFLDRALAIPISAMPEFDLNWPSAWGKMPHDMLAGMLERVEAADPGFWGRIPAAEADRLKRLASAGRTA